MPMVMIRYLYICIYTVDDFPQIIHAPRIFNNIIQCCAFVDTDIYYIKLYYGAVVP